MQPPKRQSKKGNQILCSLNAHMNILRKGFTAYKQKRGKQHRKRKPDSVQQSKQASDE
jgi:hypothetical protein